MICGRIPSGLYGANSRGDIWCASHLVGSECHFCGVPANSELHGVARCLRCALGAVDSARLAQEPFARVMRALEARGLRFRLKIRVILRPTATFRARGLFHSDATMGVTISERRGVTPSRVGIGIALGLPRLEFERVVAHELTHVFMFERSCRDLPPQLQEGFAEYVSHTYLAEVVRTTESVNMAASIRTNPDPVYGVGYRMVARAIAEHGAQRVYVALARGMPERVGLNAGG